MPLRVSNKDLKILGRSGDRVPFDHPAVVVADSARMERAGLGSPTSNISNNPSRRNSEDGFSRRSFKGGDHENGIDIEAPTIERWGSVKNASEKVRRTSKSGVTLGKFGSQSSVSVLDHVAAGGSIDGIPVFDIYVKNLTYKVSYKSKKQGTQQKTLLNGVSAEAHHGEILAIVGPSGSGKTTFLDTLAGRVAKSSLEGEIFVNGELIDDSFQRVSGYVMQDDANFPMLTVRETLLYSARLRLPRSMPISEKRVRVDNMINQLGLAACADMRVGNDKVRGVSGGERRRVSIGADLIHDPAVLFLDEPTSGLDSTSALSVMQNLSRMAKAGRRTVLLTIHQPSYRILDTLDKVVVLGQGNVIYYGPPTGLKNYFDPLGRSMPENVNVIEYSLDTVEDYQRSPEGLGPLIQLNVSTQKKAEFEVEKVDPKGVKDDGQHAPEYATSFPSQCFVLASRNIKNTFRTPELFISRAAMMLVVSVTVGTLFLRSGISAKGVQQRASFIAFSLALLIFTSTEALGIFIDERHIYIRETSRGTYRSSSYVIAGAMVTVPSLLILAVLFSSASYFIVGFVADARAFFFFILVIWLTLCTANSFVCFISGLVPNFSVGNGLCSAVIAYFFLFSGFFIPRSGIPKYWIWLHYLSLFKYPLEALLKNEFGNHHFRNTVWYNGKTSEDVLKSYSAGKVHLWLNVLVMIMFFAGYRIFFWAVLKYFTKGIRK